LNLSKENCVCPGGKHFTGLQILPLEVVAAVWTKAHKVYDSIETAMKSIRKQPQPVRKGDYVILSPLRMVKSEPELVLLFVNAEQADRVLGLVSFKGAEPFTYYPVSNICSSITNALVKGKPEINFSKHGKEWANWSPDEIIIALPYKDFESAVENISSSGFGTAKTISPLALKELRDRISRNWR